MAGRAVTTIDGLDPTTRDRWADAFTACGASQCGFCTPGIIMRLAAPSRAGEATSSLLAHLCRCTGWRTILEADALASGAGLIDLRDRDLSAAALRASIEGRTPQRVGAEVALGGGGFADDAAPPDALVAVPDGAGGWAVAETLSGARSAAAKVQGRRTTLDVSWPMAVPEGEWDLRLATTWVEPAYLETDASWCAPGGDPVTPLGNGGAFGGKLDSIAPAAARELADRHGRVVRVLLSREDCVRLGPKRPPLAAGVRADGFGAVRVARTPGITAAIRSVAPNLDVEEVDIPGPPTSVDPRGAGWIEAAVLLGVLEARLASRQSVRARSPQGARPKPSFWPTPPAPSGCASGSRAVTRSIRSCCAPTASAPRTWRSVGFAPRVWPSTGRETCTT